MMRSLNRMKGWTVEATDGEVGEVEHFYFDDERWVVRYIVVNTGNWLTGDRYLISPLLIDEIDRDEERVRVSVNGRKILEGPTVDTEQPVSRRVEAALLSHYRKVFYWGGTGLWGGYMDPRLLAGEMPPEEERRLIGDVEDDEIHLRSTREVEGYSVEDDEEMIGYIDDFVVDEESWKITSIIIQQGKLFPVKRHMIEPHSITGMSWSESTAYIDTSIERRAQ